jgi:hypothetical protein
VLLPHAVRFHQLLLVAVAISISACTSPTSPDNRMFVLAGVIRDTSSTPVADALVQVASGPLAGRTATTDTAGRFQFSEAIAVAEPTTLIVLKAGYESVTVRVDRTSLVITLSPVVRPPIEGNYTIGFTAAQECSVLPSSIQRREYPSMIAVSRQPSALESFFAIELSESNFFPALRILSLSIQGRFATFVIASVEANQRWGDDLPVYERVSATEYIALHGKASATMSVNDTAFTARFDGVMSYCPRSIAPIGTGFPPQCAVPAIECRSDHHQITGLRR